MSKSLVSSLMTGICYFALQSHAISAEQSDVQDLGPIVVTASRTEQSLDEVTRSVAVIESEEIERAVADGVTEVLRNVPGVKIIDSGVAGMKRISIRGEEASRNVVLVDGQEITDHTSYGPLFLISPSDIERIEVVKGPGSVLHGSKAIGGVVNIITKKGADRPVEVEVGTSFDSSTDGIQGFGSVSGTVDRWDYRFSGSKAEHGDRETAEGTLDGSAFGDQSLSAYVGYNGDQHKFSIKAERYELESEVYSEIDGFVLRQFDMDLPKRDRSKVGFFYDFTDVSENIAKLHLDGYFQQVDRIAELDYEMWSYNFTPAPSPTGNEIRENYIDSELRTFGLNGQADLTLLDNVYTTVGFQAVQDQLDKYSVSEGTDTAFTPGPVVTPVDLEGTDEAKLTTLSAFIQNEWDLSEDLTFTSGSRYYYVQTENEGSAGDFDENDQAFVSAIGVNYAGFDSLSLRAHLSQGYVYPTLVQSVLGTTFTPAGIIHGNTELDPETSVTAEIGARYEDYGLLVDVSAFYTDAEDYIAAVDCDGTTCASGQSIYMNIDSAKTWGLEVAASYEFEEMALTPYANLTVMHRQYNTGASSTFDTDTPLLSGRVGVTKDWMLDNGTALFADLYSRFASERREKGSRSVTTEPGFATLNLAGGMIHDFDEHRRLKVNAAVENIFDLDYKPSISELTAPGRTYKLSASVVF